MRILDLDLDCFIEEIAHFRSDSSDRLDDSEYPPWNEHKLRHFLEEQCGMSMQRRVPGRVFVEHVEAFHFWRGLLEGGALSVPFELTHVDAHSDMGIYEKGSHHIVHELLFVQPERRLISGQNPMYLSSGSYIAFALAMRWISKLTFVYPELYEEQDDYYGFWFKDFDPDSGFIEMKGYREKQFPGYSYMDHEPEVREPAIPFIPIRVTDFHHDGVFDFATICQSPGFTPSSADFLIDIFRQYITEL